MIHRRGDILVDVVLKGGIGPHESRLLVFALTLIGAQQTVLPLQIGVGRHFVFLCIFLGGACCLGLT